MNVMSSLPKYDMTTMSSHSSYDQVFQYMAELLVDH